MITPDFPPHILAALGQLGVTPEVAAARGLPLFEEADELVVVEVTAQGREHRLEPAAAQAWVALRTTAAEQGVSLYLVSAFRSIGRQAEIIRAKLERGLSLSQILAASALPGFSEHHTGRAMDIGTPGSRALEPEFEDTPAFRWLGEHAAAFGFSLSYPRDNSLGYMYEPWHWCYQGKQP